VESIYQSIEILSKEKGIDTQIVLDAVKDAMLIAARKHFGARENYETDFDQKNGGLKLYAVKTVVETVTDPYLEMTLARRLWSIPCAIGFCDPVCETNRRARPHLGPNGEAGHLPEGAGGRARNHLSEYADRVGELVNTSIKRVEGLDLVVDLGKTEARLPKREQSRLESYSVGDRLRCVIKIVDKSAKGPGVVVSRGDAELVRRLFEQEVPEIYDGTVTIRACARKPGSGRRSQFRAGTAMWTASGRAWE